MKLDYIDYIDTIEKLRIDDFYDIFSDEELIELIDESDYLWEDDELNPLDF